MKLADFPELASASEQDKMELINDLLRSMGCPPYETGVYGEVDEEADLPDEVKTELDRRWAEYVRNPEIGMTLEEVIEKAGKLRKSR